MRHAIVGTAMAGFLVAAASCRSEECLPPNPRDLSAPDIRMIISYHPPGATSAVTLEVNSTSEPVDLEAANAEGISVFYSAHDADGLRRLQMGAAILTTVGVGIESRRAPVDPIISSCPVADLSGTWRSPPGDPGRSITLGLVAESWSGPRASTRTVTVRLR